MSSYGHPKIFSTILKELYTVLRKIETVNIALYYCRMIDHFISLIILLDSNVKKNVDTKKIHCVIVIIV